jgi:hypothetical protein
MPTPYTPYGRQVRSVLLHAGDLGLNRLASAAVPTQFAGLEGVVAAGSSYAPPLSTPPVYVYSDAGVSVSMSFDELIIDPLVTVSSTGQVSSIASHPAYRHAMLAGRPFWLLVRTDGYGCPVAGTRSAALALAQSVVALLWSDSINYLFSRYLAGFAFLEPNLNVYFPDGSVIDRQFQNALVQSCRDVRRGCTFVTTRPSDATTLVGPRLNDLIVDGHPVVNPNSGKALPHQILGCSPVYRDRLAILYPNAEPVSHNTSVVAGQLASTLVASNRDPGFTPNLDVAYIVPTPETAWVLDHGIGVAPAVSGNGSALQRFMKFLATVGVNTLGVQGGRAIPAPDYFLPADPDVNTTGSFRIWSDAGFTYVSFQEEGVVVKTVVFDPNYNIVTRDLSV